MRDDTPWWDDDDEDERVAALQHVLAPLREAPRPWGDLLAQMRFAMPERRVVSGMRWAGIVAGLAAALFVGWIWGRGSQRVIVQRDDAMVAAPARAEPLAEPPPPIIVRVPVPVPIDPASKPHDDLVKLLQNIERNKTLKALVRLGMEADREGGKKPHDDLVKLLENAERNTAPSEDDDDLPEVLNTTDIKAAIERVKARAKACGPEHGAKRGEIVKIKLTVKGATGRVTSAVAQSPHAGTELGRCVADALSNARFHRFRRPSLGVVYPVSM